MLVILLQSSEDSLLPTVLFSMKNWKLRSVDAHRNAEKLTHRHVVVERVETIVVVCVCDSVKSPLRIVVQ